MSQKYATNNASTGYNITGHYDSAIHKQIPDGAIPITDEQWQLSCSGRLRIENGAPVDYSPAGPSLAQLKIFKRQQVEKDRDDEIAAGVDYNGYRWQTDKQSRENISGTLTAITAGIPLPQSFTWRTEDDQNISADASFMLGLSAVVLAHGNACYQRSWDRKAQIDAATTVEELEGI